MTWSELYQLSRPHRLRTALFRVVMVSAICALVSVAPLVVLWHAPSLVMGLFAIFAVGIALMVSIAFLREGLRNYRDDPLVLVGRVVQRGAVWDTDSGGPTDVGVMRFVLVFRVTIDAREAFRLDREGRRTPAPEHAKRHVIDQPKWYRRLKLGEETLLVCVPRSTDPAMSLPRAEWPEQGLGVEEPAASRRQSQDHRE